MTNQLYSYGSREPNPHKTSHQAGGADEIDATGLTGRCNFVDRGDPQVYDFIISQFTLDGNPHDMDWPSFVPSNAKAILYSFGIAGSAANLQLYVRPKEKTSNWGGSWLSTYAAGISTLQDCIIPVGPSHQFTYTSSGSGINSLFITIRGWWI